MFLAVVQKLGSYPHEHYAFHPMMMSDAAIYGTTFFFLIFWFNFGYFSF